MNFKHISMIFCLAFVLTPVSANAMLYMEKNRRIKSEHLVVPKGAKMNDIVFDFSYSVCNANIENCNSAGLGIQNVEWKNDSDLDIEALIELPCNVVIRTANYAIRNKLITLIYYVDPTETKMQNCRYRFFFQLKGLPHNNYRLELKEINTEIRCGTPPPRNRIQEKGGK